MKLEKEEAIFVRRIQELEKSAFHKGIRTYTDFLNLNEISIFHSMEKEISFVPYALYGGYPEAERVMICFYGDCDEMKGDITVQETMEQQHYPIACVCILAKNEKFATELSHRDYLGAIMNTGTNRNKIGDIVIKDKKAYCFCDDKIAQYLVGTLEQVGRTSIKAVITTELFDTVTPAHKPVTGSVSSLRLDALIALAFHSSRSSITGLIEGEKVFVNSRMNTSNSYIVKEGDVVSVRGYGKFRFQSQGNMTKKGRFYVTLLVYDK